MPPEGSGRRWPALAVVLLRRLPPLLVLGLLLAVQFIDPPFRARLRDNAFDQLQSLAPLPYRDALPVRVIAIDDASLASLGQWPWPRTVLAALLERLQAQGARVVAFDLVLAEADRTSPEQLAAQWPGQPALRALLQGLPAHDQVLAERLAQGSVALGFPVDTQAPGSDATAALPAQKARFLVFGGAAADWLPAYPGGVASLPGLAAAATGSGAISLQPGSDGVLRAMPLVYRVGDALYPGLALEALRLFAGLDNLILQIAAVDAVSGAKMPGIQGVGLGDKDFLPTMLDGRVWLHFRPLAGERYIAASDLLAGRVDDRLLKDHLVFVAATAKGLGDTVYSPLGELIPGIEGHVQLVEQLLSGDYLLRPVWENDLLAALLLGLWLLLGWLLPRHRPIWSVLLAVAAVAGVFALAGWLFVARQLLLDPFYPGLAVLVLFLAMVLPQHIRAEREQRWIQQAFARYVSPNRVKYLQAHPQHLELGGVYRECSFVMTDLAGFTSLMEQHPPDRLAELLNDYLDNMVRIVFRHDGTLDRIVGDAVVAMFSAPVVQADHAARALACALDMDAFARRFGSAQRARGIAFGRTRIGVHTGTVLIGNFGGRTMLDYRALGDAVNTAARLETINAQLGTRLCVSAATANLCPGFVGRPVGRLLLKGKREAVDAFEPLTAAEAASPRVADYRAAYALLDTDSAAAGAAFARLAGKYPEDPLAVYHGQRLAAGESGSRVVLKDK